MSEVIVTGEEFRAGNVFIRLMVFEKAGDVVHGHKHTFDHVTYCARGALLIEELDDNGGVVRATEKRGTQHIWTLIKAGVCHRITALEDHSVGHCIYSHRTPQGDIVQECDGWKDAYD